MIGYSETEDGLVVITMTLDDYQQVVFLVGVATGHLSSTHKTQEYFRLMDRLNRGNPQWTPYFPDEKDNLHPGD